MRRILTWLASVLVGTALLAAPAAALARPKIDWAHVDVPNGPDATRRAKLFREALIVAAKKANFGGAKAVTLSARVTELTLERRGDVLRVTCAVTGRVHGGASAKSRLSFGGSPNAPDALEKQVVTMVANGIVARLAQIARAQAVKDAADATDE